MTGSNWTGEYDIYAKNTRTEAIRFDSGLFMVGYALSEWPGGAASIIPGTDKVTIFDPLSASNATGNNPNITLRASWFVGTTAASLVGGRGIAGGIPRPYGFNVPMDLVNQTPVSIPSGETVFLARVKFRDNGLFGAGGFHDLVIYDYPSSPSNYACTSLFDFGASPNHLIYHDGPNWEENSRLRLVAVPEPGTILIISMAAGVFACRCRRRK